MNDLKKFVAEFLGTFYLCFAGIGAIVSTAPPIDSGIGLLGIALAHGLALSIAVSVFGGISGGHANPAVTMGFAITGRISPALAMGYIISQLLGATAAAWACLTIFPEQAVRATNLGIPLPNPELNLSIATILLVEFILTFLLITSVFGAAVDERGRVVKIGGFAIGLTVAFDILVGGSLTGASMNPARSFGPALVQGNWSFQWCYWVAPIAGGIAAALLYHFVLLDRGTEEA